MIFEFMLPFDPIAWKRPGQGKHGRFDTQKALKDAIGMWINTRTGNHKLLVGYVQLNVIFYVPIPSSLSMKKQYDLNEKPCNKRPDVDNYLKFLMDTFTNAKVWTDDAIVVLGIHAKMYSNLPRMEVIAKEISIQEFHKELTRLFR